MKLCNGTARLGMRVVLFAAAVTARAQPGGDCGALANLKIEDTNLLSAAIVPAGGGLPEYCRVLGYVRPAINFEVRGWAYNNRVAENDYGWRAVTETARVAKALVKTYYGAEQTKAYFAGCSTGGRMANMEARKFPNHFDGIISGAPTLDYTGLPATFFACLVLVRREVGRPLAYQDAPPSNRGRRPFHDSSGPEFWAACAHHSHFPSGLAVIRW